MIPRKSHVTVSPNICSPAAAILTQHVVLTVYIKRLAKSQKEMMRVICDLLEQSLALGAILKLY